MLSLNIVTLNQPKSIVFRAIILLGIAYRSHKSNSLTTKGIIAAFVSGLIHSLPVSNLYLILILTFYLTSSKATKYKEDIKQKMTRTLKATVDSKPQSQRTHVQVLANSFTASVLIVLSTLISDKRMLSLLKAGIIGHYAAVQADTWSSELGILSATRPFLITTFEKVPPGTNGGVTTVGIVAGILGAALISIVASFTYDRNVLCHFVYFTLVGLLGTLIDSLLGAVFQSSLVDSSGLVIEPIGGARVDDQILIKEKVRSVAGADILSNNHVNIAMAVITSFLSMVLYEICVK